MHTMRIGFKTDRATESHSPIETILCTVRACFVYSSSTSRPFISFVLAGISDSVVPSHRMSSFKPRMPRLLLLAHISMMRCVAPEPPPHRSTRVTYTASVWSRRRKRTVAEILYRAKNIILAFAMNTDISMAGGVSVETRV